MGNVGGNMEKIGAYVIDEKGNAVPDPDDEAMAQRHGIKKTVKKDKDKIKEEVENATGK